MSAYFTALLKQLQNNLMYRNIALTYIMFCLCLGLSAQPNTDLLSVNEGLSQGMVFDMLQAKDDYLWIATKGGLNRYDGHRFKVFSTDLSNPFSIATTEIHKLFEDSRGWIWVVYQHGIDVYEPGSGRFFHLKKADLPAFNGQHVGIAETPSGVIWMVAGDDLWRIGASEASLQKAGKDNRAILDFKCSKIAPPKSSVGDNSVRFNSIAFSKDQHLFLGTDDGLYRLDPKRNETVKVFTEADGLQNNEFNQSSYFKTKDGRFIFGGVNSFSVFHSDSLISNQHLPQTHIVGLQVNNQPFPLPASALGADHISLKLSHDQNLITLEFAALDFTNPSRNLYRYQFIQTGLLRESGDKEWVVLGNKNTVQFANLQPGSYTFKVQGRNNDGLWSEQPAELHFSIRPPWWKSWAAYLFYFGTIAAVGWLFYQYRLRQRLGFQETLRLKELDDFKSRFFTNITHEFRTPLMVILGMTERLIADGEQLMNQDAQGKLGLIKRNGENLLHLINQILDLAKLESKSLKINYVQGDVLPYLRYISEGLHSLANAQNVLLRVESKEAKIVMDYDPERLLQIVYNLLSNAIKFTPSGGKVLLEANVKDAWLHLSVSDSGVGVPPDELPFLFDRFFQAKNQASAASSLSGSAKVGSSGTGIGLSLTHELVKALGGEISVESTVGVGSMFLVKLPVTNKSVFLESGASISLEGRKPATAKLSLPKETQSAHLPLILLIEDNPDVVEYLAACLQGKYSLNFAYNGRAGIEKALETIPDLIVSDVMMPEKDGFEVVETLKNNELTSHIPIVLLTAKADVQSRIVGLKRGADAYLSKPFHQEELLIMLANLQDQRKRLQAKYRSISDFGFRNVDSAAPQSEGVNTYSEIVFPQPEIEDVFLQKVHAAIMEHLSDAQFSVRDLCRQLGTSQPQLHRKITALTGKNTTRFIRSVRLNQARELLLNKKMNVTEAAYASGFDDPKYFSRVFQEEFGVLPSKV
jgi:signal transduction histidine kinase/CheY-like chemotaxis protein